MKIRISKNKKAYEISILKKNQIIETYQINKIEQFYLQSDMINKIKKVELTFDVILSYYELYPLMNKHKILKLHYEKFNEVVNGKDRIIIKNIINKNERHMECITYYIHYDIIKFLSNNKINHNKCVIYKEKKVLQNKNSCSIILDEYGIVLVINKLVKYHLNKNIKQFNGIENIICAILFANINIKKLYVLMQKNIEHEYSNFIKYLYDHVEDRVNIIVEKI